MSEKKSIITIEQNKNEFEVDIKVLIDGEEKFIACEAHILATIIVKHLQQGTFNNELNLQMKDLNHIDDEGKL